MKCKGRAVLVGSSEAPQVSAATAIPESGGLAIVSRRGIADGCDSIGSSKAKENRESRKPGFISKIVTF